MSRAATNWAWGVEINRASLKLILLSLADRADENHCCFPSIARLEKDTCLDKKTIQAGIAALIKQGLLIDTGERKGVTKRVKVLRLPVVYSEENQPENGNITKTGNVPENGGISKGRGSPDSVASEEGTGGKKYNDPENGNIPQKGNITVRGNDPENGKLNDPENGKLNDPENGIQNLSVNQSEESISLSGISDEIPDAVSERFLKRHPEAKNGVYTPGGKKWGSGDDLKAARWIFEKIQLIDATAKTPNWAAWANTIRLMRQEGKTHREICDLFRWASEDSFWSENILCPDSLRKQWTRLVAKRQKRGAGQQQSGSWENTDWADPVMGELTAIMRQREGRS